MKVTALLLNWKRQENIVKVIQSIRDQSIDIDIWLWNNNIEDNTSYDVDVQINSSNNFKCWPRWLVGSMVDEGFIFTLDDLTYLKKYILNKDINSKLAFKNVNEIGNILYNEQQLNLDIISQKLFNSKYYENDNFKNFVMFPIDLLITSNFQCITKTIPIFNRIWYETDKQCVALIPIGDKKDDDIIKTYNEEKKYIKSYLNPGIQIEYYLINTQYYNDNGLSLISDNTFAAGGNLHCLIKNKY